MATQEEIAALEEFKAHCRQAVASKKQQRETEEAQRKADYEALLAEKIADAIGRLRSIPDELRPFVRFIEQRPTEEQLRSYPLIWVPRTFRIEAPRLAWIGFLTEDTGLSFRVKELAVEARRFQPTEWEEAVADAAAQFEFEQQAAVKPRE